MTYIIISIIILFLWLISNTNKFNRLVKYFDEKEKAEEENKLNIYRRIKNIEKKINKE